MPIPLGGQTSPPPWIVTVPVNPALHWASPPALMETASAGYRADGSSCHIAGFKTAGDGGRSNIPVAVNWTIPFGKLEAVAVAGITVADTNCRGGVLPQASRFRNSAKSTAEQKAGGSLVIEHLRAARCCRRPKTLSVVRAFERTGMGNLNSISPKDEENNARQNRN
jgi:hypothetical protein